MSKFTIFFCLLVGVACVSYSEASIFETIAQKVEQAQKSAAEHIKSAIDAIQKQVEHAKQAAIDGVERVKQKASEIVDSVVKRVNEAIKDVDKEINQIVGEIEGTDVTECTEMAAELRTTALAIIANASACVSDKIEQGNDYIATISKINQEVNTKLTQIGKRASECTLHVTGVESAAKALGCLAVASKDAIVVSTKDLPKIVVEVTKLGALVATVIPSLHACGLTTSIATFIEESREITSAIEACVSQKLEENGITTMTSI